MLNKLAAVGRYFSSIHGVWAFGYCVFLGVLSALAFPPYPLIPFFFIAIILVLLLLSGEERVGRAFLYGFFFGIGQFGFSLSWITESFYAQTDIPAWAGPIMISLLVLLLSLSHGMAFMITRLLWHRTWVQRAMAFASLYLAFEFLRGWENLLKFPWNPTSLVWWPSDVIMQNISFLGSFGLGLFTILIAGFMAPLFDENSSRNQRLIAPGVGVFLLALMFGFGLYRYLEPVPGYHEGTVYRMVQPNIPQLEKWDPNYIERNFRKHMVLSVQEPGPLGPPDVIIWAETAVPYDMENQTTQQVIQSWLPGKTFIAGSPRRKLEPQPVLNNSLYVLGPGGQMMGRYDKTYLVPFGEYVPWRPLFDIFGVGSVVNEDSDFDEGPGIRTMVMEGMPPFSPLICYEIIFSGGVLANAGSPAWMLNITNDAWFGTSAGPYQHFEMARARAIEEGTPVLRVAGTGISAVIGPRGEVLQKLGVGEEGVIDTRLPRRLPKNQVFYFMRKFLVFGLAGLFFLFGAGSGRPERSRKPENT